MSNSASEPIDLDVTDASTASKRPQWTLPPRPAMPKTTDPEMIGWEFRDNLKTYVVEEKHASMRGNTSWIWRHGFQCHRRGPPFPHPQKPDWLCSLCWDKKAIEVFNTGSTSEAIKHLDKAHNLAKDGPILRHKPIKVGLEAQASLADNATADENEDEEVVYNVVTQTEVNKFNKALIAWIVLAHMAMASIENEAFRLLILCLNPGIHQFLYKSATTIRLMVIGDYEGRKLRVKEDLAAARSKVHISFDMWTSPNKKLAMLGIVAHYLDRNLTSRSILISLKKVSGSHSGENMGAQVVKVLREFGIEQHIGYFISDNVPSNDLAVDAICRALGITNAAERRLRCLGHILNLAAKAFLFGKDVEDALDFEVAEFAKDKIEVRQALELLVFWRKFGPVGKLHNLILWISRTPERVEAFMKTTIDEAEASNELFIVRDNATRWNSSYLAIHRALKLKSRIKNFLDDHQADLEADTLNEDEWQQLTDIETVLAPFQSWTKHLEGQAKEGIYGSVWEVLPAIESLIQHLDAMKLRFPAETHPRLATSLNLAWDKLDDYYKKLDDSPAYAVALLLHPQFRIHHFKEQWKGHLSRYLAPMQKACRKLYDTYYNHKPVAEEEVEEETDFAKLAMKKLMPKAAKDQYQEYITGSRVLQDPGNLFHWWAGQTHISTMQQMAFDHLCIPATSCEAERAFSGCKYTISDHRSRLGEDILEALECDGAWLRAGL